MVGAEGRGGYVTWIMYYSMMVLGKAHLAAERGAYEAERNKR